MHGPSLDNLSPFELRNVFISAFATRTMFQLKVDHPGKADGIVTKKLLIRHIRM